MRLGGSAQIINPKGAPLAREEWEAQLLRHLQRPLARYLINRWKECQTKVQQQRVVSRYDDIVAFQQWLNGIQAWPQESVIVMVKEVMDMVESKFSLKDCLKVIFIARATGLAAIRQQQGDDKPLAVSIPTIDAYLHHIMVLLAREIVMLPCMLRHEDHESPRDIGKKRVMLMQYVANAIRDAITDLLPHSYIMDSYLSQTLNGLNFQAELAEESTAEPEIAQSTAAEPVQSTDAAALPSITAAVPDVVEASVKTPLDAAIETSETTAPEVAVVQPLPTDLKVDIPAASTADEIPDTGLAEDDDDDSGSGSDSEASASDSASESEPEPEPPRRKRDRRDGHKKSAAIPVRLS